MKCPWNRKEGLLCSNQFKPESNATLASFGNSCWMQLWMLSWCLTSRMTMIWLGFIYHWTFSRWWRCNKDFDYNLGKINAYGKLKLMNMLNIQHSDDWGWTKHDKSLWRRIFVLMDTCLELFMKKGISGLDFIYAAYKLWVTHFRILDELGDVFFFVGSW